MKRLKLAGVLVGSVLVSVAVAQTPVFHDFDFNNNGEITQEEFQHAQQLRMTKQAEEGKMMRNAGNAPAFEDIDANKDGIVNGVEFQNHQKMQMQNRVQEKANVGQGGGVGQGGSKGQGTGAGKQ